MLGDQLASDDNLKFPLFERVYAIVLELETSRIRFPKRLKYTLGEKLSQVSLNAIELVVHAITDKEERLDSLKKLINCLETLRILVRLSHDMQAISSKRYERFSESVQVGREG